MRRLRGNAGELGQHLAGRGEHDAGAGGGCVLVREVRLDDDDALADRCSRAAGQCDACADRNRDEAADDWEGDLDVEAVKDVHASVVSTPLKDSVNAERLTANP